MKLFGILLCIFILQLLPVARAENLDSHMVLISKVVTNDAFEIKELLEKVLPPDTEVVYTVVPRGLIVSIKEEVFFNGESTHIKASSVKVLDAIISVLNEIGNNCTVESHTEGHDFTNCDYNSNWEISMARANSITDYLVYCGKVPVDRVFSLGFGDCMPFRDSVSSAYDGFDKRIDFVIFDYEHTR